jgi:hypothetical protein
VHEKVWFRLIFWVEFCIAEPFSSMMLGLMLEPSVFILKKMVIEITVAERAYIWLEIFEDVLPVTSLD